MRYSNHTNAGIDVAFADHRECAGANGVDGLRKHIPLRMRLCTRRASETMAADLRGKRVKPLFPRAIPRLLPSCSAVPGSRRSWHRQRHGQPDTSTSIT